MGGTHCVCDPGYSGSDCSVPETPNPDFLKEDFEGTSTYKYTQYSIRISNTAVVPVVTENLQ